MANKGSNLAVNQSLNMEDFLVSPNGTYTAFMQDDGNFVVLQGIGASSTIIWASGVAPGVGQGPYRAVMQNDGNFVIFQGTGAGSPIWATGVAPGMNQGPYSAVMQDDGDFVINQIIGFEGQAIWAVNGPRGSSLAPNQFLNEGAYLISPNGNYTAIMQNDGNFVVYQENAGKSAIWASGAAPGRGQGPYSAILRNDGEFVVFQGSGGGSAIWSTEVAPGVGQGPYGAVMQNDGSFVIYQGTGAGRQAIWTSTAIPYFYGNAGIPRGQSATEVGHRYIGPHSLVFLTVDTTAVPGGYDVALPGVRLNNRKQSFITISTLDESSASESCGVPLSYLVVNQLNGTIGPLSYTTGTGAIAAHADSGKINTVVARPDSTILLTVDATLINDSVHLPGLKVSKKDSGSFTVTTLGLEKAPPTGIRFNWMIVNGGSSALAGSSSVIPHGAHNISWSSTAVSKPAAVFLTVDASSLHEVHDVALPGVKVNNHGDGWFTVTTSRNTNAPESGVPFDWLVVQPPPRWEEYGPTVLSGNCWTVAVDPNHWNVVYVGSNWGGVWKTVDGGKNWAPAWDQPQIGIYRLLIDPMTPGKVYALDSALQGWFSLDAGNTWNQLPSCPPSLTQADITHGAAMALESDGTLWVASLGGLAKLPSRPNSTWSLQNPDSSHLSCTDVVIGQDGTIYAAIRDSGVYRFQPNQAQWQAINKDPSAINKPMRLAVGQDTIILNANQNIYTHPISTLPGDPWASHGKWCGYDDAGQGGYALSVAVSPTDDQHFISFGNCGWVTFDGGAHHFPDNNLGQNIITDPSYKCGPPSHQKPCENLAVGQDDHQVVFFNDQCLALATDNGPRFSTDGGKNWGETQAGQSRISLGPPISKFYNLQVSQPDQFGRVLVTGNVQDVGSQAILGNQFGMGGGGGEIGLSVPAAPVNSHDSTYDMPATTVHFYGTDASEHIGPRLVLRTVATVPGPYYVAPPGEGEVDEYFPNVKQINPATVVLHLDGRDFTGPWFPFDIQAIATHPTHYDEVLVGTANGDVYRSVAGSKGGRFEVLVESPFRSAAVTSLTMATGDLAYVGYQSGDILTLVNPFSETSFTTISRTGAETNQVVAVALDRRVDVGPLYIAYADGVYVSENEGISWFNITGPQTSGLGGQLHNTSNIGIIGMALDANHRFLYVATGIGLRGTVWRKNLNRLEGNDVWEHFGTGLPDNVPITGLGVAPEQGLFISTQGRGIWWRRDLTG